MFDYEQIVDGIQQVAPEKNPLRMAIFIYHVVKQNSNGTFVADVETSIKRTIRMVRDCFSWGQEDCDQLKSYLIEFTKYYRK